MPRTFKTTNPPATTKFSLTPDDRDTLQALSELLGITYMTDVVRYAIKFTYSYEITARRGLTAPEGAAEETKS